MSPDSRKLLDCFRKLSEERKTALLEFAAYLADKEEASPARQIPQEPLDIPRPESESVIKAVRRLRETYPMLDQNRIFSEVSTQMTRHVMQGIPAVEVIDQLEIIFRQQYEVHSSVETSPVPAIEDNSSN